MSLQYKYKGDHQFLTKLTYVGIKQIKVRLLATGKRSLKVSFTVKKGPKQCLLVVILSS